MVSSLASSGERQRSDGLGHSGINARLERVSGTPRRGDVALSKEKAVQDAGLKDYRLGECLGKGAFGSVYKGFNWGTGEAVAVKQIKISDLPRSELRMIEAEIDLLKNLNHDNIVKYLGFVKSPDYLNIILEYCENGSLHSICKNYGKFPENLVGVYMAQILQGLLYLHDQGVIHRDIKGANILTTKDGKVKLADFGVSTSTLTGGDKEAQVVGTPYWMAPEVIQLSGATTASDIWSLGCTVIELLDGKPPYHKLAPMPALFAIVNDDHPPLPEGVSAAAQDFLLQCFQKDPRLRVSARKLLKHAWIVGSRRSDAPASKVPANYNEAVEEVKQWNEALKSPNNGSLRSSARSSAISPIPFKKDVPLRCIHNEQTILATPARGPLALAMPHSTTDAFRSPESNDDLVWDKDFASSISPSALQLPHLQPHDNFGGMFSSDRLKSFASMESVTRLTVESYDEHFEGDLMTIKPLHVAVSHDNGDIDTLRPSPRRRTVSSDVKSPYTNGKGHGRNKSAAIHQRPKLFINESMPIKFLLPEKPASLFRENSVEDYSDLFEDDTIVDKRLHLVYKEEVLSPKLFHPSDLQSLPRTSTTSSSHDSIGRQHMSRQNSRESHPTEILAVEIERYAEGEDDEDFSDMFVREGAVINGYDSVPDLEEKALMLHSGKLSNNSWLGDEDDEDDPFASMEHGFDEMDLQANIARDKHARLASMVEGIVSSLKTSQAEDVLDELSEQLLDLLFESPESRNLILNAHGLLPILEILESCTVKSRQTMVLQLLKAVNGIIDGAQETQENLCFLGGIPIVSKFAGRQFSNEIRLEAAAFVRQMFQTSTLTLQMFVSAGGLNILVEFLDEDYDEARDLVLIGVNGIWSVFEMQGPTPKNDFCRIFSRSKILYPLSLVLSRVLDEDGELPELIEGRIVSIFYLFSQAENYVKEVIADRQMLKGVLKDLRRMSPSCQITMLKFIKNLSMLSTTLDVLHSANAIEVLITLLDKSIDTESANVREISNQVLNTMYNLCRLSKVRQEDAAVLGIIPLLKRVMLRDRPPKEFALPILCDMAHSGKVVRRYLWQNRGLQFYISLLADQYWQVTALDAIFVWLQEETSRVEKSLLDGKFTEAIVSCFNTPKITAFDSNLLEPLQKLLRLSPPVAASLCNEDMFGAIVQKLTNKKAVIRLNLLRIVRSICEPIEEHRGDVTIRKHGMFEVIEDLAEADPAVLVRNMACELVKVTRDRENQSSGVSRRHSVMRNGSLRSHAHMSSPSIPNTPTQASRARESTRQLDAARLDSNFRRPALPKDHISNDLTIFRPRSRDSDMSTASSTSMVRTTSSEMASGSGKSKLPRSSVVSTSKPESRARPTIMTRMESRTNGTTADGSNSSSGPQVKKRGQGLALKVRSDSSRTVSRVLKADDTAPNSIPITKVGASASPGRILETTGRRRTRLPSQDAKWI